MPNVFQQLDDAERTKQKNVFQQLDDAEQVKHYRAKDIPAESLKHLPESASNFARGIGETLMHPIKTIQTIGQAAEGAALQVLPKGARAFLDDFSGNPELTQKAIETANGIGGMYKQRYGSYDAIKRTLAEDPVGAAGDLASLFDVGMGVVGKGARVAGATRTANALKDVTAGSLVVKAASKIPVVGKGVKATARVAKSVWEAPGRVASKGTDIVMNALKPEANAFLELAGDNPARTSNALRNAHSTIPGVKWNAGEAQAAAGINKTKLAAAAKAAEKMLPDDAKVQNLANKKAILDDFQTNIAKTPEEIERLQDLKERLTGNIYNNFRNRRFSSGDLDDILSTNAGRRALETSDVMASNLRETPRTSAFDARGNEVPVYSGETLHRVKQALDKMEAHPAAHNIDEAVAGTIGSVRRDLLGNIDAHHPTYNWARKTFANLSNRQDKARIGQLIMEDFAPVLKEGTADTRANAFVNSTDKAFKSLVKESTGQQRFIHPEDLFNAEDMGHFRRVIDEVKNRATFESDALKGSQATNKLGALGDAIRELEMPHTLNPKIAITNAVIRKLAGKVGEKQALEMARTLLSDNSTAAAIEDAIKRTSDIAAFKSNTSNALRNAGRIAPAVINAMSPRGTQQRENQLYRQ